MGADGSLDCPTGLPPDRLTPPGGTSAAARVPNGSIGYLDQVVGELLGGGGRIPAVPTERARMRGTPVLSPAGQGPPGPVPGPAHLRWLRISVGTLGHALSALSIPVIAT